MTAAGACAALTPSAGVDKFRVALTPISPRDRARHVPVVQWPRTPPFHGGNTGSNPVGDANQINNLE